MNEEEFWATIWRTVGWCISCIVVSIASCSSYRANLTAEAIKSGADPIDVMCAISYGGGNGEAVICGVRAAKVAK